LKKKPSQPKRQTAREFLELQRLMAGTVMQPLGKRGSMKSKWVDGRAMKKVASTFIKPNDRLTSVERLEIYNRQYWFRLKDCFYEDYPGLRAIVGDRRFERLACAYLERHPSQSFTLRNLGRQLVKFLEVEPRWIAPHRKIALDMARLEWAHVEAFDNEAKPPLKTDDLLGLNPARIHLNLQPYITLLKLQHEVDEFLIQVKHGAGLRSEASNAMEQQRKRLRTRLTQRLKPKAIYLAVHRHNHSVYYKRLEAGQYHLLSAIQENSPLEEACVKLAEMELVNVDLGAQIKQWFEDWASLGWFCRLK
jgi:hypothetical protein